MINKFFILLSISNFVLEIFNITYMKKSILIFVVSAMVLATTALWIFSTGLNLSKAEIMQFVVILVVVVFALYLGIMRFKSAKRGEPADDEMTKKVLKSSAAASYYISLYLWLIILYLKDRIILDMEVWLGMGILGMAVIWALTWVFYHFRGVKGE